MQTERRTNRSSIPAHALSLALAESVRRNGARAAVLATDEGLLLAGAGAEHNLDAMAAFAPFAAWHTVPDDVTGGQSFHTAPIRVDGEQLFLAAVGAPFADVAQLEAAAIRLLA